MFQEEKKHVKVKFLAVESIIVVPVAVVLLVVAAAATVIITTHVHARAGVM